MDIVKKWLAGKRNFIVGAAIYKQVGTDEKLKKLFQGKADKYLERRLAEAMEALVEHPVKLSRKEEKEGDEMPESTHPVLAAFRNEWLPVYQRMNYLRHEIDRWPGNSKEEIAQREPIAFEILELEQKCMGIWQRRKYYQEHKTLPQVKEDDIELPDDPVEMGLLIQSTKRNIRRNKQFARENPGDAVYPIRIKYYEQQLDRIMQKKKDGKA